jgi:hypothetical protein
MGYAAFNSVFSLFYTFFHSLSSPRIIHDTNPEELQRREERLEKIEEIKAEIEKRAQVRYDQEKAEYDNNINNRTTKEKEIGRKLGGRKPKEQQFQLQNDFAPFQRSLELSGIVKSS